MRKKYFSVFIIFLSTFFCLFQVSYAYDDVAIPNRDGEWTRYADIYTYNELYSVLEDINYDYVQLLEEFNSQEDYYKDEIKELKEKNLELSKEIDKLKDANTELSSSQELPYKLFEVFIIFISFILLVNFIPAMFSKIKEKFISSFFKN